MFAHQFQSVITIIFIFSKTVIKRCKIGTFWWKMAPSKHVEKRLAEEENKQRLQGICYQMRESGRGNRIINLNHTGFTLRTHGRPVASIFMPCVLNKSSTTFAAVIASVFCSGTKWRKLPQFWNFEFSEYGSKRGHLASHRPHAKCHYYLGKDAEYDVRSMILLHVSFGIQYSSPTSIYLNVWVNFRWKRHFCFGRATGIECAQIAMQQLRTMCPSHQCASANDADQKSAQLVDLRSR